MVLQQSLFTEEELGGIPLEDVFEAYFECRKKKRNTCNALAFESEYERKCVELWREINSAPTILRVPSLSSLPSP
jgi:RNA-directed DNA polymerase